MILTNQWTFLGNKHFEATWWLQTLVDCRSSPKIPNNSPAEQLENYLWGNLKEFDQRENSIFTCKSKLAEKQFYNSNFNKINGKLCFTDLCEHMQCDQWGDLILTPSLLLQAPPGVKRNLMRTYESWNPEYISKSGSVLRAQALFALAWFHAVVQERRMYIPQVTTNFIFYFHFYLKIRSWIR